MSDTRRAFWRGFLAGLLTCVLGVAIPAGVASVWFAREAARQARMAEAQQRDAEALRRDAETQQRDAKRAHRQAEQALRAVVKP